MIRNVILCILVSVVCSCSVELKMKGLKKAIPEGGLVNITTPIIYVGEGIDDLLTLFVQDQIDGSEKDFLNGEVISGENVLSWIIDYVNNSDGGKDTVRGDSGVIVQGLNADINPSCLDIKIQCSRLGDKNNYLCSYNLENMGVCFSDRKQF